MIPKIKTKPETRPKFLKSNGRLQKKKTTKISSYKLMIFVNSIDIPKYWLTFALNSVVTTFELTWLF